VDNDVSRENVSRAATKQGWGISEITQENEEYHLHLKR
jgi:hypothetical protein